MIIDLNTVTMSISECQTQIHLIKQNESIGNDNQTEKMHENMINKQNLVKSDDQTNTQQKNNAK